MYGAEDLPDGKDANGVDSAVLCPEHCPECNHKGPWRVGIGPCLGEGLPENIAALSAILHTNRRFPQFHDALCDKLGGFPGI